MKIKELAKINGINPKDFETEIDYWDAIEEWYQSKKCCFKKQHDRELVYSETEEF